MSEVKFNVDRDLCSCVTSIQDDFVRLPTAYNAKSEITIGDNPSITIYSSQRFNWFQKKMIKWCFGFTVKDVENEETKKET